MKDKASKNGYEEALKRMDASIIMRLQKRLGRTKEWHKQREGVVSLTHTEFDIMLVIIIIIFLFFLIKPAELADDKREIDTVKIELAAVKNELAIAKSDVEESRQTIEFLEEKSDQLAKEATESKEQIDLAQKVTTELIQSGIVEENAESTQLIAAIKKMLSENKRAQVLEEAINEVFGPEVAETVLDDPEVVAEAIKQLAESAGNEKAVREDLNDSEADADRVE